MTRVVVASNCMNNARSMMDAIAAVGMQSVTVPRSQLVRDLGALNGVDLLLIEGSHDDPSIVQLSKYLRETFADTMIVYGFSLSERDIVNVLDAGADEVLTLPMRDIEIAARLRALLRRINRGDTEQTSGRLVAGDIEISLDENKAYRRGLELDLSPIEFKLLTTLVRANGRPLSHAGLLSQVWGPEYVDSRNYLRLYIRYLRSKLEDDPSAPRLILNEWGTGYRLEAVPTATHAA
jgi:two-component system, OmpR family, KDP operon response regulator KdpE